MYVETIGPDAATGPVREMYDADLKSDGFVATDTILFSLRPDVYGLWTQLSRAIRKSMRLRRYELVTIAAARALGSRACVSGHASLLIRNAIVSREQMERIVRDFRDADLDPIEVALMELAETVAVDAHRVPPSAIERLRGLGLRDDEIFGVVLAASARSFYSKCLDAMGCPPSPELADTNGLLDLVEGRAEADEPSAQRAVSLGCA
jgi:alkylhydroperoxidase family enzyme